MFEKDTSHISLSAVSIEPSNDGVYYCRATVLGNTLWDKIEITHSGESTVILNDKKENFDLSLEP